MEKNKSRNIRNGVVRAIVEQGLIRCLAGKRFAPKKGRGAKYDRRENKRVEDC